MMKKTVFPSMSLLGLLTALGGCGSSDPHAHNLTPPSPPSSFKVPHTKAEKIAAIQKAPIGDDQKKAAIAKVNASPDQ